MATTLDINKLMYSHPLTKRYYGGTWSRNNVPVKQALKKATCTCFIINSSPSYEAGSHWTAVWIGAKKNGQRNVEHFCSYGIKPPHQLHKLLSSNGRRYKRNKNQLQEKTSILCGYYCMLFLICKSCGGTLEKFVECFTSIPVINDIIVQLSLLHI